MKKNFIEDIKNIKWYSSVYSKDNVDEAAVGFQWEFARILDNIVPLNPLKSRKIMHPGLLKIWLF